MWFKRELLHLGAKVADWVCKRCRIRFHRQNVYQSVAVGVTPWKGPDGSDIMKLSCPTGLMMASTDLSLGNSGLMWPSALSQAGLRSLDLHPSDPTMTSCTRQGRDLGQGTLWPCSPCGAKSWQLQAAGSSPHSLKGTWEYSTVSATVMTLAPSLSFFDLLCYHEIKGICLI